MEVLGSKKVECQRGQVSLPEQILMSWDRLMDVILVIGSENLKPVSAKRGSSGAQPRTLALRQVPTQQALQLLGLRGAEREEGGY